MRVFTAIELASEVRSHLARISRRLDGFEAEFGYRLSLTREENLHITLKFFGEVALQRVPELCALLGQVDRRNLGPVRAALPTLFPGGGRRIGVIAVGLDGDVGAVSALYTDIETCAEQMGFARERRAFVPHVTFARARPPLPGSLGPEVVRAIAKSLPGPTMQVLSFSLFESRMERGQCRYVRLAEFPASKSDPNIS